MSAFKKIYRLESEYRRFRRNLPWTVQEFAEHANLSKDVVVKMITDGKLRVEWISHIALIPISELRRVVEERLDHLEMERRQLVEAVEVGLALDVGLDKNGHLALPRATIH